MGDRSQTILAIMGIAAFVIVFASAMLPALLIWRDTTPKRHVRRAREYHFRDETREVPKFDIRKVEKNDG